MTVARGTIAAIGGLLFFVDQGLKYLARGNPNFSFYLWRPWLGWEHFANDGIAFSLPFPRLVLLFVTPILIFLLLLFSKKHPPALLIVFGALGNYLDRVFFGHTTDYIRVATGVCNLADILIIAGLLFLVLWYRSPVVTDSYVRKNSVSGDLRH